VFIHNPSVSDAQWEEVTNATKTLFFLGYILYEGPLRTPNNGRVIFRTDFGASYQGDLLGRSHSQRVRMFVVPDPLYNRLS
jgi:hypothetical protein